MESGERSQNMAWHERHALQPDFVPRRFRDYLINRPAQPTSSLKFANRVAFIGDDALGRDLECFVELARVLPGDSVCDADLLLIGGDWPRAGEPWREALLNVAPRTRSLRETIAQYRARGIPSVLWLTGEADTVAAMAHLKDAVDQVFVPEGVVLAGARNLDIGLNVKLFNPFRADAATSSADEPYFRFILDGAHELSQFVEPETSLDTLRPFLEHNSWLIDSTYHYQVPNMKLPATCRRRFLGHLPQATRASLLKLACGMFLPSILKDKRPQHFQARAREAAACKAIVFSDAGSAELVVPVAETPASFLSELLADDVARMALAHKAWRTALSQHTFFERLESIFASVNVVAAYQGSARPSVNLVMPTIRPDWIPFALEMFKRQTWKAAQMTIVANGVPVSEDIARLVRETPNVELCAVSQDKTLGYCMNFGIDRAGTDYWAKWDDDDLYGPHYLEDHLLQRKYTDFDIAGKAAIFTYIEDHDCTYLRNSGARDTASQHLGGGTLLVKNEGRYFAEDGRGGEDRAFLFLAKERGDRIVAGDPFNFVQVRRRDIASHTWTLASNAQDLRGPRRAGSSLESIIL